MEKDIPYVSLRDFERKHPGEKAERQWYAEVISPRNENKERLILESPELASKIFHRYEDFAGLHMLVKAENIPEIINRNARMVLGLLRDSEIPKSQSLNIIRSVHICGSSLPVKLEDMSPAQERDYRIFEDLREF